MAQQSNHALNCKGTMVKFHVYNRGGKCYFRKVEMPIVFVKYLEVGECKFPN